MKRNILYTTALLAFTGIVGLSMNQQTAAYVAGDTATDFRLKNIDGKLFSLADMKDAKGFIVVFTCNHCPYAIKYEQRIIDLDKKFKPQGFPVIAINPNDSAKVPDDSYDNMQKRAQEKGYTFPYLYDRSQDVAKAYGALKTPHVYLLLKEKGKLVVKYVGAIDNNYEDAAKADRHFVAEAIAEIQAGKNVTITGTRAIGCSIKWKD
ncbi:MAG: thioredoxin family protein [Bacteroidetes bacterium]|nr:thioredoxin family protein [Bacteroidota bacterium]